MWCYISTDIMDSLLCCMRKRLCKAKTYVCMQLSEYLLVIALIEMVCGITCWYAMHTVSNKAITCKLIACISVIDYK